jgi:hypothetical protein
MYALMSNKKMRITEIRLPVKPPPGVNHRPPLGDPGVIGEFGEFLGFFEFGFFGLFVGAIVVSVYNNE